MAADANALTLYDYGAMSNDPLVKKITMGLYDQGVSVLDVLPIANTKSLKANGVRFLAGSLPTVGVRKLNGEPTVVRSVPKRFEEQAYIVSNQFQIDRFLDMEQNAIQDPIDVQFQAWQKSFIRTYSDKFINATPGADDDWFAGLRYRLSATGRVDYDIPDEMFIHANGTAGSPTALDMTLDGMDNKEAEQFFEKLDTALDYVGSPEGNGVVILTNDVLFRRISTAAKRAQSGNALDQTKDNYDRMITTYRNARLLQLPRKSDDSSQIITSTETAAGTATTGGTSTSLFVAKFGADNFTGWQFEPLAVKDLGIDPTVGTRRNVVVDWATGLFQANPRSVARLFGLQMS